MEKVITVSGKPTAFKATAATGKIYKERTGREIIDDFTKLGEALASPAGAAGADFSVLNELAFIMARQADPEITPDIDEWLDQFEMFGLYEALPEFIELWGLNMKTSAVPYTKKKQSKQRAG